MRVRVTDGAMISVVIPTLNAEDVLVSTLSALVPAAIDGLISEVIVVDGGSADRTCAIAEEAGARVLQAKTGRGVQLRAGADAADQSWLLFLHADTVLQDGWQNEVLGIVKPCRGKAHTEHAYAFRYSLDDKGLVPRLMEGVVHVRANVLKLPYGDQGLLISRVLYDRIGGYKAVPLMEDVDIVRRLGRRRLKVLRARALTSAVRYRDDGYLKRIARNQLCLLAYLAGVSPDRIARFYFGSKPGE